MKWWERVKAQNRLRQLRVEVAELNDRIAQQPSIFDDKTRPIDEMRRLTDRSLQLEKQRDDKKAEIRQLEQQLEA